jgi:hypothetical protein
VAGEEDGRRPLDEGDARARRAGGAQRRVHRGQARLERGDERVAGGGRPSAPATRRTSSNTPASVVPPSVTTAGSTPPRAAPSRAAIARTSPSETAHTSHSACVSSTSGASAAMAASSSVKSGAPRRGERAHGGVHLGRRRVLGDGAARDARQRARRGGHVALVRDAHDPVEGAERGAQLGGGGEERDDAHVWRCRWRTEGRGAPR